MWEKFKNLFKKKEEPTPPPTVQLQYFASGAWHDTKNKQEVVEGKKQIEYRHVITLHDGRVEIINGV